jgi:hypothetical protein
MSDERRIERIEVRVDQIKDDVAELKADFKAHTKIVEEHVLGDTKIINEIRPLLDAIPHLTEMTKDYTSKKHVKEKRMETLKEWSLKLGLLTAIVTIFVGISKLFL